MSWEIKHDGEADLVVLDSEMGIQNAAEFYQAILPLASSGKPVRVDASAAKSVHTSIIQTLYALSQAVADFGISSASEEFRSAEARVGLLLKRSRESGARANGTISSETIYA